MSERPLNQKGLTLVELLVAMTVGAMIAGAVVASVFQLFMVSDSNSNYNAAFSQVQNAGYWVSRDAVQAQVVDDAPPTGEFLILEWDEWDGTPPPYKYKVVYTLEGGGTLKDLKRTYSIIGGTSETVVIAQYIDSTPANTSSSWDGINMLTLVITAQVGDQTVTRTYKVEARSLP